MKALIRWWKEAEIIPNDFGDRHAFHHRSLGSSTVGMSLKYAAGIDPELRKIDYEALGKRCEATNALWQKTLNPQEVAAVSCYTRDTILYRRINYALRALDESLLTAYTPFLKIFHRGVAKLEHDEFEYNIYRGDDSDYGFHQENSVVTLPLSFTASEEYARNKAGNASEGSCTIAILLANSGRLIEDYTSVPGEDAPVPVNWKLVGLDTPSRDWCPVLSLSDRYPVY
ncbi:unnamed protein product [Adineta ricciae]|uniref:Uncharacterized protein n=1 Tax=Adineta ricciae TaxID=249248 RepID=A0A815SY92_ADIRI|nr:unnamed protein product [Adineta ricciae]